MKNLLFVSGFLLAGQLLTTNTYLSPSPYRDVTNTHLISKSTGNTMDGHSIDIDGDGDIDIVLAMEFQMNKILINDGTGKLIDESEDRFPSARHDSEDIAIADFDNDGDLDIVFVSEDDQVNEFYQNVGNAQFKAISILDRFRGTSNAVEAYDFNNDGYTDLLIANAGQNFLLINQSGNVFIDETAERLDANTYTTQDVELADIDNDGDMDILEANEAHNRILINDGNGFFEDQTKSRLPQLEDQTREVELGDIDNDGDLDIHFSNVDFGGFGNPQNRLLRNDGNGIFSEATELLPVSDFRTVDADFVDLNNDGFLDILTGNRFNGPEQIVLINQSGRGFVDTTDQYFPSLNMYPFDFQIADYNGDGELDIFICGFRGPDKLLFHKAK
ncbi:VCBS repeat-containing protein [Roseivirga sp. E12]|uniref:FG-GAP repeat domain-containing protein n=1 Tax=Roseivirga sp. E12 TaxID=2819237 RepID=UPI001ABCE7EB|nr:VCBS repeat-containing protein [Roseivirga sp. E12]MBO3697394.1 VCBS repeat-containing protein [Roseivirga sp. E12]